MTLPTNLLLGFFLLIGPAQRAIANPSDQPNECGLFDRIKQKLKCAPEMFSHGLQRIFVEMDMNEIGKIRESCEAVQKCFDTVLCYKNDKEFLQIQKEIKNSCSAIDYLATDFKECGTKIVELNTSCKRADSCDEMFGVDHCYKKLIVENCGMEQWRGYQRNIINYHKLSLRKCNYDELWGL